MVMHSTTMPRNDEQLVDEPTRPVRRMSADLAIGLTLLGVVIVGKLLWALSDGSMLAALGAR